MSARRRTSSRSTVRPQARRTVRPRAARTPRKKVLSPGAATSGVAPGMQPINSYLAVANVAASIAFLEAAFGFSRGVVLKDADGQPRYAEMRHGSAVLMLVPKGDRTSATGGATALYAYVDDVDGVVARAREAGAGVGEAEDKPWGDRVAAVTDPDGYRWVLATFKKLAPFT